MLNFFVLFLLYELKFCCRKLGGMDMKKVLLKSLVLTCVITGISVSTVFASVSQPSSSQKQRLELLRQQNEALQVQNDALKQQADLLRQQADALKQGQTYTQAPTPVNAVQMYPAAQVYAQPQVPVQVYSPAPMYVPNTVYVHSHTYNPGPWYGGLGLGYVLGAWTSCGRGWGHGCCHRWR